MAWSHQPVGNSLQGIGFVLFQQEEQKKMVTMVGNENDIQGLVKDLILLEYDAIAAYESCIERLDDETLSSQISDFKADHDQHLSVLKNIAAQIGIQAPTEGDMKQYLTTGKIALADMFGDRTILVAMKTNEDDTVTAYERAARHEDALPESKAFFLQALAHERRHREWMESTAERLQ